MADSNRGTAAAGQQNADKTDSDPLHRPSPSVDSQPTAPSSDTPSSRTPNPMPSTTVRATFQDSRNSSPSRKTNSNAPPNTLQSARARSAALSPTRTSPASPGAATPSAAAVQRALSATNSERMKLSPSLDEQARSSRTHTDVSKAVSPKLSPIGTKAFPPPSSTLSSRQDSFNNAPQQDSSVRSPSLAPDSRPQDVPEKTLSPTQAQSRPPRGPSGLGSSRLETVKEFSVSPQDRNKLPENLPQNIANQSGTSEGAISSQESTIRSAKSDQAAQKFQPPEKTTTPQPQPPSRKPSTSSLKPHKTRANAEGAARMIVETETVPSIPQNTTNTSSDRTGSNRVGTGGSLRSRPSSDTIRPRKEKKKTRRPPPIVSGPGSSKAELFEQRVASEIEGESTDSDETFVYESNPAEAPSRLRHHSRTPSTASLSNPQDRPRALGRVLTGGESAYDRPVRPKRSMKFASSSYAGSSFDDESTDANQGTVRTHHVRSTPRPDVHHKHVGRVHRGTGHGSDSPLDSDSPFSQAQRMRTGTGLGWRSPRGERGDGSDSTARNRTPTKSNFDSMGFDTNASGTSDDERMPLLRTLRNPRTRGPHRLRQSNIYDNNERPQGRLSRMGTLISAAAFCLLIFGVAGAGLFATSKPLYNVSVMEIQNVLASEQEIMLDLLVEAVNPNVATIAVNDMDVNVFAKSRYVGDPDPDDGGENKTSVLLRSLSRQDRSLHSVVHSSRSSDKATTRGDGVDDGTDPIPCPPDEPSCPLPDKDHDRQTMLLGRIFHFDSALSFEPSPLRRAPANSSGELRLAHPGNRTESGGSARWERVTKHPFELIIRGILKYQLPLSTRVQTRSVGASVAVFPEEDVGGGSMRTVMLSRLESAEKGGKVVKFGEWKDADEQVSIPEGDGEVSIPEKGMGWA
ncbi:MAG: hypothetical protein Q9162_006111 [Coniocarpon cinnabarinum]